MNILPQFHSVTSDQNTTFEEKVTQALVFGLDLFGLDTGIVSKVHDSTYVIKHSVSTDKFIKPGLEFCVADTYCKYTLAANKAVSFHEAGKSEIATHPCYINQKLESYIGAPIFVQGKVIGTVNFTSLSPRKPFSSDEIDYVDLIAQWLGAEISRLQALEQLKSSYTTLKKLERVAQIGTWEIDFRSNELIWSKQTKALHEVDKSYQPDVSTAINFYKEGKSRDLIQTAVQDLIETGTPYSLELTLITAKHNEIQISTLGEAEFHDGQCVRLFGVIQNISHQSQQRDLLDKALSRMKLATDSGQIGIWELDLINDTLIWDEWMYKLYGLDPNTQAETYSLWASHLHPDDRENIEKAFHEAIACKSKFDSEFRIIWSDKSVHYIRGIAKIERDENNNAIKMTGVNWDVTKQKRLTEKVSYQASHDALTGLKNRTEFEQKLNALITNKKHAENRHALMFIDLDQFKIVNDTCGHAIGDEAIVNVSNNIATLVPETGLVARLGGDEFGIILEDCSIEKARSLAQKICDKMETYRFNYLDMKFRIGTSIGLVAISGSIGTPSDLMKAADEACYVAKELGRNRVYEYSKTDEIIKARQGDISWVNRLEQALSDDHFTLYFQIIQPLDQSNEKLHLEILLRLNAQGDVITPGAFLPAAERYNMVPRIDQWVLNKTIEWIASLSQEHLNKLDLITINLSGQSVDNKEFRKVCCDLLDNLPHSIRTKLCIEITETVAIRNLTQASLFFEEIRHLDVLIALDDFGSGSSSFSYLKNLKIDILKIDGQFIKDILNDPIDEVTVKCFAEIARVKNLKTVAEWVESKDIFEKLRSYNIDFAQGFYIQKPKQIEHVFDVIDTNQLSD